MYRLYRCIKPHAWACGYYGDVVKECTCSNQVITRYQKRISGPMLDRIDIHIEVPRVDYENSVMTDWGSHLQTCRRGSMSPVSGSGFDLVKATWPATPICALRKRAHTASSTRPAIP